MGICGSSEGYAEKLNEQHNREIAKKAEVDAMIEKLLLLGTGESGKSTLFKNLIHLYGKGMDEDEIHLNMTTIQKNVISSIISVAEAVENKSEEDFKDIAPIVTELLNTKDTVRINNVNSYKIFWAHPAVKKIWLRRDEYETVLGDSLSYFMNKVDQLFSPAFVPSFDDILHNRNRTTGIVEAHFTVEGMNFHLFDVGGQRNERKKWIHCFQNCRAVIFVAALSEYDQVLYEDNSVNRMKESLELFGQICNAEWFVSTSMILFLNKSDQFRQRIETQPITRCFPDYKGSTTDFNECVNYIGKQYVGRNTSPGKTIFIHITMATDTQQMGVVFNAVKETILTERLKALNLDVSY
jgi:GTPase SAR1 family protein